MIEDVGMGSACASHALFGALAEKNFRMRNPRRGAGDYTRGRVCSQHSSAKSADPRLAFMQRDTGADPRLIFVEIDAHHFSLAHADKIIHERWLTIFRPDKHHSDFRF